MLVTAPLALEPREPAGEKPAPQEALELRLDEARQPAAVTHPLGLGAERLVVLAHDLIQDALRRRPRLIPGRSGHGRDRREGRATQTRRRFRPDPMRSQRRLAARSQCLRRA
jgi:hypothetical protein